MGHFVNNFRRDSLNNTEMFEIKLRDDFEQEMEKNRGKYSLRRRSLSVYDILRRDLDKDTDEKEGNKGELGGGLNPNNKDFPRRCSLRTDLQTSPEMVCRRRSLTPTAIVRRKLSATYAKFQNTCKSPEPKSPTRFFPPSFTSPFKSRRKSRDSTRTEEESWEDNELDWNGNCAHSPPKNGQHLLTSFVKISKDILTACTSPEPDEFRDSFPFTDSRSTTPHSDSRSWTPDSRFNLRSPTPPVIQVNQEDSFVVEADGRINFFPNCDARVWLRSCTHPVDEPMEGVMKGSIPKWLHGSLVRNGPGRMQVGNDTYNHIFDGSALLHRFNFKDGHVTYRNKFLQSRSYLKDTKAQRIVVNYFGTRGHPDPCKTILQNLASKFSFDEHFTDNAQISVYPYGDGLYALTETPFVFRIDPDTLETKERVDMTKHIAIFSHTAHPHVENSGNVFNIGQGVGLKGPVYHICQFLAGNSKASPFEAARIIASVKARWIMNPSYMHSFSVTENYFVLIEQPLVVSTTKVMKSFINQEPMIESLQWWEKETRFYVIDRNTARVHSIAYETDTFFFLHTINAYEEQDHIVIDISAYRDAQMLNCMYVDALKNASYDPCYARMFRGRPKRWVLPLKPRKDSGTTGNLIDLPNTDCKANWVSKGVIHVQPELLADIGCEVPRINYEKYNGKHYRYFYAICSDVDHPKPGTLVKVDAQRKTHWEWSEDNIYPSEPIFVPSPNAEREDDGVILSTLLRCKGLDNQICLVVLNASTFRELGRVEFECSGPVPKCLHGWFVPQGQLKGLHSRRESKEGKSTERRQ